MRLRVLVVSAAVALAMVSSGDAPFSAPRSAEASVSVRISLPELVAEATYVIVGTPAEHYSQWEDLAGGRRIVTYTRVTIDHAVIGSPGSEIWVRTLGGGVGHIGQAVPGEARLIAGERALIFLTQVPNAVVVTELGQGHYPIALDEHGTPTLKVSPERPGLLARPGPTIAAEEILVGATVDSAIEAVQRAHRTKDAGK